MSERDYETGKLAAWRSMLGECLRNLPDVDSQQWAVERLDVILALRSICNDYGDNNWSDDTHLGDVLRKHLEPYLDMNYDPKDQLD